MPKGRAPSKLTAAKVLEILELVKGGARTRDISRQYGISEGHVCGIKNGSVWTTVTGKSRRRKPKVKDENDYWFK